MISGCKDTKNLENTHYPNYRKMNNSPYSFTSSISGCSIRSFFLSFFTTSE